MKIKVIPSEIEFSRNASNIIRKKVLKNPSLLICPTTGNSPLKTYEYVVQDYSNKKASFSKIKIIKPRSMGRNPVKPSRQLRVLFKRSSIESTWNFER